MPVILYEIRESGDDKWRVMATIKPADPPGKVIDTTFGRLDVLMFSCMGPSSAVSRTIDTINNPNAAMVDVIRRGETTPLCHLYDRESFELEIKDRPRGKTYQARWTHYDSYTPGWTRHA